MIRRYVIVMSYAGREIEAGVIASASVPLDPHTANRYVKTIRSHTALTILHLNIIIQFLDLRVCIYLPSFHFLPGNGGIFCYL